LRVLSSEATPLLALFVTLRSILGSRVNLQVENLALRHQIGVLTTLGEEAPEINLNGSLLLGFSIRP
jgi:hypothetical protein